MKKILVLLALFAVAVPVYAETIHVKANGVVCDFCARTMEKVIRKRPEVKDMSVNMNDKVVRIELKDGQTLDDKSVTELIQTSGYTVASIERK